MTADDWPEVRRIYAEGIATADASLEREAPDWHHFDHSHRPDCRFVARDKPGGPIVGWTALSAYSARRAYLGVAWESVYVGGRSAGSRGRPSAARGPHPGVRGGRPVDAVRRRARRERPEPGAPRTGRLRARRHPAPDRAGRARSLARRRPAPAPQRGGRHLTSGGRAEDETSIVASRRLSTSGAPRRSVGPRPRRGHADEQLARSRE